MKADTDRACSMLAEEQDGLFSRAQALAVGHSDGSLHRRVSAGRLCRVLPQVFASAGAPRSWRRDVRALVLHSGDGSAASHRAAARLWSFSGFEEARPEIATTNMKRCAHLRFPDGTRGIIHRVDEHLLPEIVEVDHFPVTSIRRTVLDLAGLRDRRMERTLDAALRRGFTDVRQLWRYLEQEWMRGRRGTRILRHALIPRTEGRAPSESELELMARRIIDRAGLQPPEHQFDVMLPSGPKRIDLAYPSVKLAIECDGYIWHMDRQSFEADRRRDNELRALGWTVLRFTWGMLAFEKTEVATTIRSHLDQPHP